MFSGVNSAIIREQVIDGPSIHVLFPHVEGIWINEVQKKINLLIEIKVNNMMRIQGWNRGDLEEMEGTYQVTLNKGGLLSIRFEVFSQIKMAAHPSTLIGSLTVDLNTGQVYELYHLFRSMSGHALTITNFILREIEKREIPLIVDLKLIPDNHPYYLTEDAVVIYFQEGEIAPRVYGPLEFPIPYNFLKSIIDEAGPLKNLL